MLLESSYGGPTLLFFSTLMALPFAVATILVFYFIYKFITMNNTPFRAMKAIYVYIAALIGLVVVSTGLYGLIMHLLNVLFLDYALNSAELVTPIARIIVGTFIMVPHWAIGTHFFHHENKKR